jgi:deoxycytidylate deaminase
VFPYDDKKHPSPQPQADHPDIDKDHFMAMACLALQRSKDPSRKVL